MVGATLKSAAEQPSTAYAAGVNAMKVNKVQIRNRRGMRKKFKDFSSAYEEF